MYHEKYDYLICGSYWLPTEVDEENKFFLKPWYFQSNNVEYNYRESKKHVLCS